MSGVCAFEVYLPPRTSIEMNISQSLLIPHCFFFHVVLWPCLTFTNSESNGKVQYNIRTTKKFNFRYSFSHADTLWMCRTQILIFLL